MEHECWRGAVGRWAEAGSLRSGGVPQTRGGEWVGAFWGLCDNAVLPCSLQRGDRTPAGLHDVRRGGPTLGRSPEDTQGQAESDNSPSGVLLQIRA